MNEKKKSGALRAMVIISLIILVLGVLCAGGLYSGLSAEIANGAGEQLIVGGTDIVPIIGASGKIGAMVISCLIVSASMVLVMIQWIGYAIIKLIAKAVRSNNH